MGGNATVNSFTKILRYWQSSITTETRGGPRKGKPGRFWQNETALSIHRIRDEVKVSERTLEIYLQVLSSNSDNGGIKEITKGGFNITNACILSHNENTCFATEIIANNDNLCAFDCHHLAERCNLRIKKLLLGTKKVSNVASIKVANLSFGDLVENLFPELIITHLIDSRIHKLVHFI